MDIYWAVFQAKPEDIRKVKIEFIHEFDQSTYDIFIAPYLERREPGYLFSAPNTIYKYWVENRLAENTVKKNDDKYIPPPEFIAVELPEETLITCTRCQVKVPQQYAADGKNYGYGSICPMCQADLATEEIDQQIEEMKEHVAEVLGCNTRVNDSTDNRT